MATIKEVMCVFQKATNIMVIGVKPSLSRNVMFSDEVSYADNMFLYLTLEFEYGLNYLVFILKLNNDWKHD